VDAQAVGEEEDLRVETPGLHVLIKIGEVGVLCHRFVKRLAIQPFTDHLDQCGFSDTDVACNRDKFLHGILKDVGVAFQDNYSIAKKSTQKSLSGGERLLLD
jgi:sugar (pentulose or hexulose) kinase